MRRSKNPCVFTGKVGAKMKPLLPRVNRRIVRKTVHCDDGPFAKCRIRIDAASDMRTLTFVVRGQVGHYRADKGDAKWVPVAQMAVA
jgi:hypothetical protein